MVFLEKWLKEESTYINLAKFFIKIIPNLSILVHISVLCGCMPTLELCLSIQYVVFILETAVRVLIYFDHFLTLFVNGFS